MSAQRGRRSVLAHSNDGWRVQAVIAGSVLAIRASCSRILPSILVNLNIDSDLVKVFLTRMMVLVSFLVGVEFGGGCL